MKARFAICLALAAASSAALPVSASAQVLPPQVLPPYEITTSVRSMGLEPISPPVRRGARYVLRAIDGRGAEVTVAADARNGRILFVRPVGYGGPVYAERFYPEAYPDEAYPPRGQYRRQPNYEQRGNYERQPPRAPAEPSVIYAPRDSAGAPQAPTRAPSAAKPPAPKVAAKPPTKPASAVEAAPPAETPVPEQPSDATTGATSAPPPAENPALAIPPVQNLE